MMLSVEALMSKVPKTRIVKGDHYADILVRYSEESPPVYYWICQKFHAAEILGMGTAFTFEEAEQQARDCLDSLNEGSECAVDSSPPKYRM